MASCCGAPWQMLFGKRQVGSAGAKFGGNTIRHTLTARMQSHMQEDLADLDLTTLLLRNNPQRPLAEEYKLLKQVGSGAFGSVFLARSKVSDETYAVKVLKKESVKEDQNAVVTELEAMISLRHPNVLCFYEFFETNKCICMVVELCDGGDFHGLFKAKTPELQVQQLFRDVFLGVSYCHAQNVCHRDLKMENVLTCDGGKRKVAKIIDFGLAAIRREHHGEEYMEEALGTKFFVAPEVLDVEQPYGMPCDLWSVGIMLYIVLTNQHPFAADATSCSTEELFSQIQEARLRTDPLDKYKVKQPARNLLVKLLDRSVRGRISAEKALNEDWLSPEGYSELKLNSALASGTSAADLKQRIVSYGEATSFEKMMRTLASHRAKREDIEAMRTAFVAIDRTSDGTLTKEELLAGIKTVMPNSSENPYLKEDTEQAFKVIDRDGNGRIDYSEWLCATMKTEILGIDAAVKDMFHFLDSNHDGFITNDELCAWVDVEEASRVIQENDTSRDGKIDVQEFMELMHKMAGQSAR